MAGKPKASRGGIAAWAGIAAHIRSDRMRHLALSRWGRTSKSKRSEYGRRAARARWGTK